ncbi:MAG TPA: hypothetical protein VK031_07830 [Tissierellaceae bacterium]|nr:hypothetical protein [Tissierellaceae bacterium]
MEYIDDIYNYWLNEYVTLRREVISTLLSDYSAPNRYRIGNDFKFVEERPEYIDQTIWDKLFIKDRMQIPEFTYGPDRPPYSIYGNQIKEGVLLCTNKLCGYFYIIECNDVIIPEGCLPTSYENALGFTQRFISTSRIDNRAKIFLDTAIEVYGKEDVWVGFTSAHPYLSASDRFDEGFYMIIHHGDVWVEDNTGLRYKARNLVTTINLNRRGIIGNTGSVYGMSLTKDNLLIGNNFDHPHIDISRNAFEFSNVCLGSESSISRQIGVISNAEEGDLSEEECLSFWFHLSALLEEESKEGVPFHYIMGNILDEEEMGLEVSFSSIVSAIVKGYVDINCDIVGVTLRTQVCEASLIDYLNEATDDGEIYRSPRGSYHRKELSKRLADVELGIVGHFPFFDNYIPIEVTEVCEDNYDLSVMDEWDTAITSSIPRSVISDVEIMLDKVVNFKLEYDVTKRKKEYKGNKELATLIEVQRSTNIEDLAKFIGED